MIGVGVVGVGVEVGVDLLLGELGDEVADGSGAAVGDLLGEGIEGGVDGLLGIDDGAGGGGDGLVVFVFHESVDHFPEERLGVAEEGDGVEAFVRGAVAQVVEAGGLDALEVAEDGLGGEVEVGRDLALGPAAEVEAVWEVGRGLRGQFMGHGRFAHMFYCGHHSTLIAGCQ